MGIAAILVMCPGSLEQTFVPPSQRRSIKFDFEWQSSFWGKDVSRVWTTTTDDGACLSNKLSNEPSAQVS